MKRSFSLFAICGILLIAVLGYTLQICLPDFGYPSQAETVAEYLLAGHSWGRETLTGDFSCPILPVVFWLPVVFLEQMFRLSPERFHFIGRTLGEGGWIVLILLVFIWRYLCHHKSHSLYDKILCALCSSALLLCGSMGFWLGCILTLSLLFQKDFSPSRTLLLLPSCWCLGLLLLWGWLIHGNPFQRFQNGMSPIPPVRTMPSVAFRSNLEKICREQHPYARIMIYGPQLPRFFQDTKDKLFCAQLKFEEAALRNQASREETLLLLPPAEQNLLFQHSSLHQIYEKGAPWLLLLQQTEKWRLFLVLREFPNESPFPTANPIF